MKPDAPAKAGPAPPAEADGNCGRSGRGSLQLVVVRKLTACSTRTRTVRAVKRGGRGATGAASHRQAVLRRARPRANTSPEPGRPNPPASTRSPVLVGRSEREMPKLQSPLRPTPGTPAGGRVRNKFIYDDIKYTPGLTGPQRPVRVRPCRLGTSHLHRSSRPPRTSPRGRAVPTPREHAPAVACRPSGIRWHLVLPPLLRRQYM